MMIRRITRLSRLVVFALLLAGATPSALAQCGYGTSEQDCRHIQRDQRAAQENERAAHEQQGAPGGYGGDYEDDAGNAAPSGPLKRIVQTPSFAAVAYARDSAQAWADWGHRSQAEAEQAALAACRADAGAECELQHWQGNGAIVVGTTGPGMLVAMVGDTVEATAAKLRSSCDKDGFGPCTVKWAFMAEPWSEIEGEPRPGTVRSHRPAPGAALWNRYCAVAWTVEETAQWRQTAWAACGDERLEKAKSTAISRCQAESASSCQLGQWTANGVIAAALSSSGRLVLTAGPDRAAANAAVLERCRTNQLDCRIVGGFASSEVGVQTRSFGQSETQ